MYKAVVAQVGSDCLCASSSEELTVIFYYGSYAQESFQWIYSPKPLTFDLH